MTYRWVGSHAFRDHANDRVIEPGEELPEDVAEQIVNSHPHDVEEVGEDAGDTADDAAAEGESTAEAPLDPGDFAVDELRDALNEGDFTDAELDAILAAEEAGDDRTTAKEAIEAAR